MTTDPTNRQPRLRSRDAARGALTAVLAMLVLPACANAKDQLKGELESIRAKIVQLEAANLALEDRLDAVEGGPLEAGADASHASPEGHGGEGEAPARSGPAGRPTLRVIRLAPPADDAGPPLPGGAAVAPPSDEPAVVLELEGASYPGEERAGLYRRQSTARRVSEGRP